MVLKQIKYLQNSLLLLCLLTIFGCGHGVVSTRKEALLLNEKQVYQEQAGQLTYKSLKLALKNTIEKLEHMATDDMLSYPVSFSMKEYLKLIKKVYSCSGSIETFERNISHYFSPYQTYGKDQVGEILLTSYYEPLIDGSLKRTSRLNTPLYKAPKNLVEVKLNQFQEELYGPIDTTRKVITAQLTTDKFGNKEITPLPSRYQIDFQDALKNKNLEIVYVDPIEAFFLHIQGSGRVRLKNGQSFTVGYQAQNGMKYEPIGKFLKDEIPKEKMSLQSIEQVLREKYMDDLQNILPLNPSYIFFKKIDGRARTTLNTEVTDRRTIAVDRSFFQLGLIGHLKYPDLEITDEGAIEKDSFQQHYVLAQDTGGAIKGTGRADLFWGSGREGKRIAGHMRHKAELAFFLPKMSSLELVRSNNKLECF